MLTIIGLMFLGILAGYALRTRRLTSGITHIITLLIWLLLFFLGIEVGGNDEVVSRLPIIGVRALALSLAGIAGSVILAKLLWMWISRKEKEDSNER